MAEFPLDVTVNMQLRSPGESVDITEDVRVDTPITVKRGRSDETESADPAKASFKLNNRHGRYSPRNPNSPYFGRIGLNTRITVSIGADRRFVGEVSEWPVRWDLSGNDVWVPIKASGTTRRLGQGREGARSSLRRYMDSVDPQPHAYWAMDGGRLSTAALLTSGSGGRWTTTSGTTLYGESLLAPWLSSGVTLDAAGALFATVSGIARDESSVAVDHVRRSDDGGGGQSNVVIKGIDTSGDPFTWIISFAPGIFQEITVQLNSDGSFVDSWGPDNVPSLFTDDAHHFRFLLEVNGANTDWSILVDEVVVMSDSVAGGFTGVTELESNYNPGDDTELVQGHWAVWTSSLGIAGADDVTDAVNGFVGETAGRRMERLADEEGVSLLTDGDLDETPAMGPQRVDTFLNLLRESEAVDMGILADSRLLGSSPTQLDYRTRGTLYNQTPLLILNYTNGDVTPPVDPTDDDQNTSNDVTVQREEGGEARQVDEDGPRGVSTAGRYSSSVTLNVATDDQLTNQAAWRLHLGTVDELRVPTLHLNLRNPRMKVFHDTLADINGLEPGDRIQVINTPEWVGDSLDLIVQGYEESFSLFSWDFVLTCTPASPWSAVELDDEDLGRLDTAGSELDTAVTDADTEVLVTTTDGPVWITDDGLDPTDDGDLPVDVRVGGEVMRVTAIEPLAWDTFSRTEMDTWGDADSGQGWVENGGEASDRSTGLVAVGATGNITLQDNPGTIRAQTLGEDITDCDIRVLMGVGQVASGGAFLPSIMMRRTGTNDYYRARVRFNTDQSMATDVTNGVSTVGSVQDLPWTYEESDFSGNDFFWVRARLDGHRIRTRVWPEGTTEPDTWHNDQTVTSDTIERGDVGVSASAFGGNDNDDPILFYENFEVVSPQRFTVTRSVNGIVKPHSVGDSLSLAHPTVLAL